MSVQPVNEIKRTDKEVTASLGIGKIRNHPGLIPLMKIDPNIYDLATKWEIINDPRFDQAYVRSVRWAKKRYGWDPNEVLVVDVNKINDKSAVESYFDLRDILIMAPYEKGTQVEEYRTDFEYVVSKDTNTILLTISFVDRATNKAKQKFSYLLFGRSEMNEIKKSDDSISHIGVGSVTTNIAYDVILDNDTSDGSPFSKYLDAFDAGIVVHIASLLRCSPKNIGCVLWDVDRPEYDKLISEAKMKIDTRFFIQKANQRVHAVITYSPEIGVAIYKYVHDAEDYEYHFVRMPSEIVNEIKRSEPTLSNINVGAYANTPAWDFLSSVKNPSFLPDVRGTFQKTDEFLDMFNDLIRDVVNPRLHSEKTVILSFANVPRQVKTKYNSKMSKTYNGDERIYELTDRYNAKYKCRVRLLPLDGIARINIWLISQEEGLATEREFYAFRAPYSGMVNELKREVSALGSLDAGASHVNKFLTELKSKYNRLPFVKRDEIPGVLRNRLYVIAGILGVEESDLAILSLSLKTKNANSELSNWIKNRSFSVPHYDTRFLYIQGPTGATLGTVALYDMKDSVAAEVNASGKKEKWYLIVPNIGNVNEIKRSDDPLPAVRVGKSAILAYDVLMSANPSSVEQATYQYLDYDSILTQVRDEIVAPSLGCDANDIGLVVWPSGNFATYERIVDELDEESSISEEIETEEKRATVKSWGDRERGIWITDIEYALQNEYDDTYHWVRIPRVNEVKKGGAALGSIGSGVVSTGTAYEYLEANDPDAILAAKKWSDLLKSDLNGMRQIMNDLQCKKSDLTYIRYDELSEESMSVMDDLVRGNKRELVMGVANVGGTKEIDTYVTSSMKDGVSVIEVVTHEIYRETKTEKFVALRKPIDKRMNEIKRESDPLLAIGAGNVATSPAYDELVRIEPEILDEIEVTSAPSNLDKRLVNERLKCDESRVAYVHYDIISEESRQIIARMISGEPNDLERETWDEWAGTHVTTETWIQSSAKHGVAKIKIKKKSSHGDHTSSSIIALRTPKK